MGYQWRKRSKSKGSWWNGSYSKKGFGVSGSIKLSDSVTWNTGDLSKNNKTPSRLTMNMGGGHRYVVYGSTKKDTKTSKSTTDQSTGPTYYSTVPWEDRVVLHWILRILACVFIAGAFGSGIIGYIIGILTVVGWMNRDKFPVLFDPKPEPQVVPDEPEDDDLLSENLSERYVKIFQDLSDGDFNILVKAMRLACDDKGIEQEAVDRFIKRIKG